MQTIPTRATIWQFAQNKPSLIVRDLAVMGVPEQTAYGILLTRGVFKWLAVRRHLIKAKSTWKVRIVTTIDQIREAKASGQRDRLAYLRGYLKAYEECRGELRALCHSERWQAPDYDRGAQAFLRSLEQD